MKKCYKFWGFVTKNLQYVMRDKFNNIDTFKLCTIINTEGKP